MTCVPWLAWFIWKNKRENKVLKKQSCLLAKLNFSYPINQYKLNPDATFFNTHPCTQNPNFKNSTWFLQKIVFQITMPHFVEHIISTSLSHQHTLKTKPINLFFFLLKTIQSLNSSLLLKTHKAKIEIKNKIFDGSN